MVFHSVTQDGPKFLWCSCIIYLYSGVTSMSHYRQFEIHVLLKAKASLVTDCEYTGHIYLAKWTFCNIESSTLIMNMSFPISFVIFLASH